MKFKALLSRNPLCFIAAAFLLVLAIIFCFFDVKVSVCFAVAFVIIFVSQFLFSVFSFKNTKKYVHQLSDSLISDGENNVVNFPLPAVLFDKSGNIVWYNTQFKDDIIDSYEIKKISMNDFFDEFSFSRIADERVSDAQFSDKKFTVFSMPVSNLLCAYFFDDTHLKTISEEYHFSRPFVMLALVDNIEELSRELSDSKFAVVSSGIESIIEEWLKEEKVIYKRIANGNFLIVGEKRNLDRFCENKFNVLNKVRSYTCDNTPVNATLSIGVGSGSTFSECETKAKKALDMSLGRGGDQAAIHTDDGYIYFGGVSNRANDSSRVSPRRTAANISTLIKQFNKVFILGHKYSDYDSVGAAMGMQFFCQSNGVPAQVVVDPKTTLASPLVSLANSQGYKSFVAPTKAMDMCDDDTLIIIVDTHRQALLDEPDLYTLAGGTVIIDHHRRSDDFIADSDIFYTSPSSSSACEMVTELIQYSTILDSIPAVVSTALLSGIVLDTKEFVLRTSQRTFEAAGFLRDNDADTVAVKKLFSIDADMAELKNQIINDGKIYDGFMISSTSIDNRNIRIITSSAADEMLSIDGVKASFVISKTGVGKVQISARSLGEENVQLIMENLGGGGHSTMAAAQVKVSGLDNAKQMLLNAIEQYNLNK
ncbi:MAG: DHH family phosphoesterase [Clostridia bacterium]|nr:DHH family phosphoesterase [Clostridia bacterium]